MVHKKDGETLDSYLTDHVFKGNTGTKVAPDPKDVEGFEAFMKRYTKGLSIERAAIENMQKQNVHKHNRKIRLIYRTSL